MVECKLYFTEEEMWKFLENYGYMVSIIQTWYKKPVYHNEFETIEETINIVHKYDKLEKINLLKDNNSPKWDYTDYELDRVFKRELKNKLLSL